MNEASVPHLRAIVERQGKQLNAIENKLDKIFDIVRNLRDRAVVDRIRQQPTTPSTPVPGSS